MAGRKENIKALFTNVRSRVIIVFTILLLIIAVIIGFIKFFSSNEREKTLALATVNSGPGAIQSIPGSLDPTIQYANLQETQNLTQAQQALNMGNSAIPTIVRSQKLSNDVGTIGAQNGQGSVGFETLIRQDETGSQRDLWVQELQNTSCKNVTVKKVIEQGGTLDDLRKGCSCIQLKNNGYPLEKLQQICSCKQLKDAGFKAVQLKALGFSTNRLRLCGFNACGLREALFSAQQMKDGGFSDGELKGAGFSNNDIIKAGGLPDKITENDVYRAGCQRISLERLRNAGVSAAAIRRISGCSAAQLNAAQFNAKQLIEAGFTAAELKKVGFTPEQLKLASVSARALLNAGFSPQDLITTGYSPSQIAFAESRLPPGISASDVKTNGCEVTTLRNERIAGVSAKLIRLEADCSVAALRAAGFNQQALIDAGFTPTQIAAGGFNKEPFGRMISDEEIKAAMCDPAKLTVLLKQGITAKKIHDVNGCDAAALKAAGFNALSLLDAGFTLQDLAVAGFSLAELHAIKSNPVSIIAKGRASDCDVMTLKAAHNAGLSASSLRYTLGCNVEALKAAGYNLVDLKKAGFTAAELKQAGFSAAKLKSVGFSAKELHDAGFTAQALKAIGFTAQELHDAGFTATPLKQAGFSAAQLKSIGFLAKELHDAGFNAQDLKAVGFTAKELQDAGFTVTQLKNAGLNLNKLATAGVDDSQIAGLDAVNPDLSGKVSALPAISGAGDYNSKNAVAAERDNAKQLQQILTRQNQQLADQRYQQKIQQRVSEMLSMANQDLQTWKRVATQVYSAGSQIPSKKQLLETKGRNEMSRANQDSTTTMTSSNRRVLVKTGDILFAVIDTSINSDEPGPILATIVSGKFNGAKLIGSFTLPSNAEKMIISFNTLSVPGASRTTSISAIAIDANTARTALSSNTDHHYLLRYGSLFASSFLEGFGSAFQSANTTIAIDPVGAGAVTIQNGVGRSTLENAVIGLSTLGKTWGQAAQQQFNTPVTVEVYSGTGIGVLFTQDVTSL
jgi:intracellular multiplication protein IcmE